MSPLESEGLSGGLSYNLYLALFGALTMVDDVPNGPLDPLTVFLIE